MIRLQVDWYDLSLVVVSIYLSASLKTQQFCETSSFFIFLNLTTLKTKLFSETSSIFEFDNTKNEATLRDFLQGSKVECRAQFPNVLRTWCVLCILTSKCASRHNGVHFFNVSSPKSAPKLVCCAFLLRIVLRAATVCNFHLTTWLHTRRFSEPTFRPSGATNHLKNAVFRDFPTFSRAWIFFLLRLSLFLSSFFFSSLLFSDSSHLCLFHLSMLSEVWLLNFLRSSHTTFFTTHKGQEASKEKGSPQHMQSTCRHPTRNFPLGILRRWPQCVQQNMSQARPLGSRLSASPQPASYWSDVARSNMFSMGWPMFA